MSKKGIVYTEKPTNPRGKAPFGRVLDTFPTNPFKSYLSGNEWDFDFNKGSHIKLMGLFFYLLLEQPLYYYLICPLLPKPLLSLGHFAFSWVIFYANYTTISSSFYTHFLSLAFTHLFGAGGCRPPATPRFYLHLFSRFCI